jgi:hypothetical protein
LQKQGLTENSESDLARFLAFLSQKDPGLAAVVNRWADLPEHIKQAITTLIEK